MTRLFTVGHSIRRGWAIFAVAAAALLLGSTLISGTAAAERRGGDDDAEKSLRILLTNDDGYDAPTLRKLAAALRQAGHDVTVVAPCTDQSGSGTEFTSEYYTGRGQKRGHTITAVQVDPQTWKVCGSPADSVLFGLQRVFEKQPDLVVSGINPGQNIGAVANHSGTVGAVITALEFGVPGIAVSAAYNLSANPPRLAAIEDTADFTVRLIEQLQQARFGGGLLPDHVTLNVNYPAVPDPTGVDITRQGAQSFVTPKYVPASEVCANCYLITTDTTDTPETVWGADTTAIKNGKISITPLNGYWTASWHAMVRMRSALGDVSARH